MWPLKDSPQLSPYFKITFKWCQKKVFLILKSWLHSLNPRRKEAFCYLLGKSSTPRQKCCLFISIQFLGGHCLIPSRPSRYSQSFLIFLVFLDYFLFFLIREKIWILRCTCRLLYDFDIPPFWQNKLIIILNTVRNRVNPPAVNSVPASSAVLRNSSRSRSCVTDFRRDGESISLTY